MESYWAVLAIGLVLVVGFVVRRAFRRRDDWDRDAPKSLRRKP